MRRRARECSPCWAAAAVGGAADLDRARLACLRRGAEAAGRIRLAVARAYDGHVLREVTEGDIGSTVVIVFRAVGRGRTTVVLAETRGERAKAYRAVRYAVTVN